MINKRFYTLKKEFNSKKFDENSLNKLVNELKRMIYRMDNIEYHKLLGDVYIELKEFDKAKKEYNYMIYLDNSSSSAFYGLFKVAVCQNEYSKMRDYLQMYELNMTYPIVCTNIYYGLIDLYYSLLEERQSNYEFVNEGYLLTIKIDNKEFNESYDLAIESLNSRDYQSAKEYLYRCSEINDRKHLFLSIEPLIILIDNIISLSNKNNLVRKLKMN